MTGLIDTDVHQGLNANFWERLELPWRKMSVPSGFSWPAHALGHNGIRQDIGPPGSDGDPAVLVRELIEPHQTHCAILTGSKVLGINVHPNSLFAMAFARAYNDWLIETWLSYDSRFRGSMLIAPQDIKGSVKEIERVGEHPGMVQILISGSSPLLFGKRYFWPLYEIAEAYNLPIAVHPLGLMPTGSGWMSTYLEHHTMLLTRDFMNHLVSLICEGVFEQFPKLKVVLIEGGVAAYVPLLWRLDKNWKAVRAEVPWLKRKPSEYIPTNIRFTTQPIEEPEDEDLLLELYHELDAAHTVMYSSDWPHWDFDSPTAIFRNFPEHLRQRIFVENARELYGL